MFKVGYEFWIRSEIRHIKAKIEAIVTIDRQDGNPPKSAYLIHFRDEHGTTSEIIRNEQWVSEKMKAC